MRFRLNISVEIGDPDPPEPREREGSAVALVERSDPHMPSIGFYPTPPRLPDEDRRD